jgi:ATP-dependent DNA helicase PIF1
VDGLTLHSFAGIGYARESAEELLATIQQDPVASSRWRNAAVLICDEMSMISDEIFDKLEYIAQHIRQSDEPFGGLQFIIALDHFQLPPVQGNFVFFAHSFFTCFPVASIHELTHVFRQQADGPFLDILQDARIGHISERLVSALESREFTLNTDGSLSSRTSEEQIRLKDVPPLLLPHKEEVKQINTQRMKLLPSPAFAVQADDHGDTSFLTDDMAPRIFRGCVGAPVLITQNFTCQGKLLRNGQRAIIVQYSDSTIRLHLVYLPALFFRSILRFELSGHPYR